MPEVKACVMAADVLMGHDPDCAPLDHRHRVPDARGRGQPAARVNRRAVAAVG